LPDIGYNLVSDSGWEWEFTTGVVSDVVMQMSVNSVMFYQSSRADGHTALTQGYQYIIQHMHSVIHHLW